MERHWSWTQALLSVFAVSLFLGTLVALGLGFDLFVAPPIADDTLDLPSRLLALQPFREAQWPFDLISNALFVAGFAALALVAARISALGEPDVRVDVLRSSLFASGVIGVTAGLLYIGATNVTIAIQYCDCGFKTEETLSQFWAINVVQGATNWLGYGALAFGALGVGLSALVLRDRVRSTAWSFITWAAVFALLASIVLREFSDTPAGDLVLSVATGLLLPAWAIILARQDARSESNGV